MKSLLLFVVLSASLSAQAESQTMTDPGSAALAAKLAGHSLFCGPRYKSNQEKGFYPLKITAKQLSDSQTQLSVTPANKKIEFGFGGNEFDPTDYTPNWFIIACGDDGRRYLQIPNPDDSWFNPKNGAYCDAEKLKLGIVEGYFSGLIFEMGGSVIGSSSGIQCCIQ